MKLILIFIFAVLCGLSVIDVRTMMVPRAGPLLILAAGLLMLALGFLEPDAAFKGMAVMTAAGLMIALLTGGLGGGDVKVFAAMGLCTGTASGLEILMLSFLISGIMAVFKPG